MPVFLNKIKLNGVKKLAYHLLNRSPIEPTTNTVLIREIIFFIC